MRDRIRRGDPPAVISDKLAALVREIDPDLPDPDAPNPNPIDLSTLDITEFDAEEPRHTGTGEPLGHNTTGHLVERWIPGGSRALARLRAHLNRHRLAAVALLLLAAVATTITLMSQQPQAEPAPALPTAIGATEQATETPDARIVVSVVGRVLHPGLVTLTSGARVLDAVTAAGGVPPGTDLTALNLARKLADGEQIYVGIPFPPGAEPDPPPAAGPATTGGKGKKGATQGQINLNTASADQLETLPGVGPTTAQRIITWRTQHGPFTAIGQLRQVGGIGDAKFSKLESLVTV